MNQALQNKSSASSSPTGISEATIQRMLSLQEQRVTLELKQADIQLRELDHNQKIADKSIDAQAEDRRDERATNKQIQLNRLVFAGFVVAAIVVLIIVALWMNKEGIVLDLVKVLCGFAGGYGISSYISAQNKPEE